MKKVILILCVLVILAGAFLFFGPEYLNIKLPDYLDIRKMMQKEEVVQVVESPKPVEDPRRNGPFILYFDDGLVQAERNYKNDELEGAYRLYHPNGNLKLEGQYVGGKMEGVFKSYYDNGKIKSEEVYKDNFLVERKTFKKTF